MPLQPIPAKADGCIARIPILHSSANVLGSTFLSAILNVHSYLFPLVIELDFIVKDNDCHKVEIFLNLINYLFTHGLFPDGL